MTYNKRKKNQKKKDVITKLSNVVKKYNDAIENISAKIVQDREGFMQQLGNIYSEGKKNFVNSDFLDFVEKKILVRDFSNNMKSFSDKSQLVDHMT